MPEQISDRKAKQTFGISTMHERMDNGELRFRLRHNAGSAYCRTEASASSGWQRSHYHRHVRETYVVEKGWMAFADLRGEELNVRIFKPGEVFTTEAGVVHNVYLPPDAVIHTVKHGEGNGEDRETDGDAAAFDMLTGALATPEAVRAQAIRRSSRVEYPEGYRHFDTLIWQVPAWSTAIFAISGAEIVDAAQTISGDPTKRSAAGLMLFLALCLLVFGIVLSRFRSHQRSLKGYARTPFWKSAQTWTQGLIAAQSAILLGVGLNLIGLASLFSVLIAVAVGLVSLAAFERGVRG